ncbi:MAG: LptF/LptG family permease [Deltaproteobacteria bacterium]
MTLGGTTLHRYVAREVALPAAAALLFLFQLLIALQLLRRSDVLFGPAVSARDIGLLLVNLTPHYLTLAMPISLLLGILVGLGRLAEDREVDALLGCGASPALFAVAPALLAVAVALLTFGLEAGPEPLGLQAVRLQMDAVLKRGVQEEVKPGVFYDEVTGLTLFAEEIDPVTGAWRHVLVNDERDPRAPLLLLAQEGRVARPGADQDLVLELGRGEAHRAGGGSDADAYSLVHFERAKLSIGVDDSLLRRNTFRSPDDEATLSALAREAEELRRRGGWWQLSAIALQRRLGIPLAALAFAWVGVPLALLGAAARGAQGARARGYVLALLAVAIYYVLQHVGIGWGQAGKVPPWLAGELPNLVAAASGTLAWGALGRSR